MDLTVQEIIAKVALRRESQLKQKHKKHILTHINNINIQSSTLIKNNNHQKSHIPKIHQQQYHYISKKNEQQYDYISKTKRNNPQNSDSFNNQIPNNSILIQKHKKLKTIFHKLKSKVEHQSQINELYSQTTKKLQLVLKKNNKLQKELDSIRSKRLTISKNIQSIKEQQSHVKSSAFFTNSVNLQKQTRLKESSKIPCKQLNKIQKLKQNHQKVNDQVQKVNDQVQKSLSANKKYDGLEQNKVKLLTDQNESFDKCPNYSNKSNQEREVSGFEIEYRKPSNSWCKNEIEQYKLMICEKEASIKKLRSMIEKQQKIITNYASISSTDIKQKQVNIIINTGFSKGKLIQKKTQKVEGTIVKLKRVKNNSSQMKMNEVLTDINMRIKKNHNFDVDSLETYIDGKTKKKNEDKQIKNYQQRQIKNKQQRRLKNGLVNIQQFTYQQGHNMMRQSHNNWEQQQEFNETSEFICQM